MGKRFWRERIGAVEMSPFQEAWINRGLRAVHDEEDDIPPEVDILMGYSAVGMAECLEAVDKVNEDLIETDLKVILH